MFTRTRILACAVCMAVPMLWTAGAVHAAAPANDTQAGAVLINTVPFSFSEDTTEATVAGDEVAQDYCLNVGAPAFEHAVWFRADVTGGTTDAILIDTSQSTYGTGIAVLQDTGGGLVALACQPRSFIAQPGAAAGTYYFVVFGDGTTPELSGELVFTVDVLPAPPVVEVTVDSTAKATKDGGVLLTGTITCTSEDPTAIVVFLGGAISQTVGRLIIQSSFFSEGGMPCDGTTQAWQGFAPATNGKFAGGKASVSVQAAACDAVQCASGFAEGSIRLTRARL
jgi:Family of unknown function (DUF6299)